MSRTDPPPASSMSYGADRVLALVCVKFCRHWLFLLGGEG